MLDSKQIKTLQQCKLFAGLSETEILEFFNDISYKLVAFSKNEIYSLAGMPYRHVDIVLAGTMVCRMSSVGGKQIEVSRLRAGHLIAPAFIFSANNLMPVSVETVEPCSILRIDKVDFVRAIDENSRLCMNFIRTLSDISVFLTHKINVLSLMTVREKVGYLLVKRAKEQNSRVIHLYRSRQQIADSFGIQKFSLQRVLANFEKEGAIEIDGRSVKILDSNKLK
jgi:CRP-like cAMP-binding protein